MRLAAGIKSYYADFGFRGVFAAGSSRLFGWPTEIVANSVVLKHPVHLRISTSDIAVFKDILVRREYDFDLPAFSPQTIVDAGANIGISALYFANKYPDAKVFAVEPEPSNYQALVKNVAPYPNVTPIHCALWKKDGEVSLRPGSEHPGPDGKWAFQVHEAGRIRVRAMTIQSLISAMNIDSIDLLKMDIEGAEQEVFESSDWLDRVRVLVIELHDRIRPGCSAAVKRRMKGFHQWERGEMTFFARQL
jgi:FkbM family methyltransferase